MYIYEFYKIVGFLMAYSYILITFQSFPFYSSVIFHSVPKLILHSFLSTSSIFFCIPFINVFLPFSVS